MKYPITDTTTADTTTAILKEIQADMLEAMEIQVIFLTLIIGTAVYAQ